MSGAENRFTVVPASEAEPIGERARQDNYGAATIDFSSSERKGKVVDFVVLD